MKKTKVEQFICSKCKRVWQVQDGIEIYNKFAFTNFPGKSKQAKCVVCEAEDEKIYE
jgi:hypothetical protein